MRNFFSYVDDLSVIDLENFLLSTFAQTTQHSWIRSKFKEIQFTPFMKKRQF